MSPMSSNGSVDLSKLSLRERARLSILAEQEGDEELRAALLGAVGSTRSLPRAEREVPDRWTQIHVLDRLEEGYRVLALQPGAKGRQSSTVWPATAVERLAILDMIELMGTGELEARQDEQNRVRLQPTAAEVSRMEQALEWPFRYLNDRPYLARSIQLRALWAAMGADIRKRCQRRKLDHDAFNREWQEALAYITGALLTDQVPVS
jgi:hypothetical protein